MGAPSASRVGAHLLLLVLLLLLAARRLEAQQMQIMPVPEHVPPRCSDLNSLYDRVATINAACCPPGAPCTDGQPTSCSVDCTLPPRRHHTGTCAWP